ncbi:MAG: aldehyde dehydrogenase family protein [Clostridiales bacterium]|nr:MAG: aldehyde dehydrogenase family protein [Clostridiales bacterium]
MEKTIKNLSKKASRYSSLVKTQKDFFKTGKTLDVNFRIKALISLKDKIKKNEKLVLEALKTDLDRAPYESFLIEISIVYNELNYHINNLKKWASDKKVKTPLTLKPAKSYIHHDPYGTVLILSPWNYPFQLCIMPLIGAISAGNTAIIKPSHSTPKTSQIIEKIILESFDERYVAVVNGSVSTASELLKEKYDFIFFTGSKRVGKIILESARENLCPVVLELGGKSPVIIDETANIKMAAKRIAFGKVVNAGQTCVAPDYALVHESVYREFVDRYKKSVNSFFPFFKRKELSKMTKIINDYHFNRLKNLLTTSNVIFGGKCNEEKRKIYPALTYEGDIRRYVHYRDDLPAIMQEEIFGPILPIITYTDINDCIEFINDGDKPLALYLYTTNNSKEKKIVSSCLYGSGCINDNMTHLSNENLPFGGVGTSGMGKYHGKYSFETFSHQKSIMKNVNYFDINLKYLPYNKIKFEILKKFFK